MMRTAISPRLAMRTRSNGGALAAPDVRGSPVRSVRARLSLRKDSDAWSARRDAGHSGMLPCLRDGFASRLPSSIANAAMTRGRVSDGTMTSST